METSYIYFIDNDTKELCLRHNDHGWFTDPYQVYRLANGKPKGWSWQCYADEFEYKVLAPMALILNEEETK